MIPYVRGLVSKQAHVEIPEGLYEEEYARNGFFGHYAHLYRSEPPVGWTRIEGNLKPHLLNLNETREPDVDDFITRRKAHLFNDDVKLYYFSIKQSMPYFYRNADADELYFVHKGQGLLETDYGPLNYQIGDYLLIPRGTVFRFSPAAASHFFLIESFSELSYPDKGMLGHHALFDPAVINVPSPDPKFRGLGEQKEYELKILREGELTSVFYPFYPINTIGWKGTLSVQQLNIKDIRPVSSDRYHLPPSAHTTFVAHNFVVCSFLPRPLENGDPEAMKVPFYHSNIDFDEVLFYHDGEFFSRSDIGPGMLTFHPQGIHHGPHPKAIERSKEIKFTNEAAVMVDTKRPLKLTEWGKLVEKSEYWKSWST